MSWYLQINRLSLKGIQAAVFILLLASAGSAENKNPGNLVLPCDGVLLREGAGNYFKIIEVLSAGTSLGKLEEKRGWLKVRYEEKTDGWISANVMHPARGGRTRIPSAAEVGPARKVNLAAIGAMVKGLSADVGLDGSIASRLILNLPINHSIANKFRGAFTSGLNLSETELGKAETEMLAEYLELSPVLATRTLTDWGGERKDVSIYGNQILFWLAEQAGAGNLEPRLFISNEGSNSICLPGGWILLGGELLDICADESEFAGIIAHELSHAIYSHGYKALKEQQWRLRSDTAFDELTRETRDDTSLTAEIQELEAFSTSVLRTAGRRHDLPLELQADASAMRLLLAGGYDANGLHRVLKRIREDMGDKQDGRERMVGHGGISLAWLNSRDELDKRILALKKQYEDMGWRMKKAQDKSRRFRSRFNENVH